MLTAIHLNDQPLLYAGEISNECADRMLPPKLSSSELPPPQQLPQPPLGHGRIPPQSASIIDATTKSACSVSRVNLPESARGLSN
jgi:hypothetical protein